LLKGILNLLWKVSIRKTLVNLVIGHSFSSNYRQVPSHYFVFEHILEAVNPLLNEHSYSHSQDNRDDSNTYRSHCNQGGKYHSSQRFGNERNHNDNYCQDSCNRSCRNNTSNKSNNSSYRVH